MHWRRWMRRSVAFGWALVAAALLAGLWFTTVRGVDEATDEATERRLADRAALAAGLGDSLRTWLDAGRSEVGTLAAQLADRGALSEAEVLERYLDGFPTFGRSALFVSPGLQVRAATGRPSALLGVQVSPCAKRDASGAVVTDFRFEQLVRGAVAAAGPAVSAVFDSPGDCRPVVAATTPHAGGVLLVLADLDDALDRVAVGARLGEGTRVVVVDPDGLGLRSGETPAPLAGYLEAFVAAATGGGPRISRLDVGDQGGVDVVAAHGDAGAGWGVVVEEDTATFDVDVASRPAVIVAGTLTVVFLGVFALLVFFDVRRQRARRRADLAKQAFFGIVSHELRTPLTVLKGTTDTLAGRWDAIDEAARRRFVETMGPQVQRLAQVVDRVLTAANLAAGTHPPPALGPVDIGPVVRETVAEFEPLAPLHTFVVHPGMDGLWARADAEALATALGQLLDNAVRFSPRGGNVEVAARAVRRRVQIVVADEGVGLPADVEPLFQAFTQGEDVLRRVHAEGGVGVGLFIVRSLVEAMGGSVRAERRPTEGSRFVLSLRRSRPRAGHRGG